MRPPGAAPSFDDTAALCGDGFIETFVRFGPAGRLAGVLCEPQARRAGASALLLNAGGDPHTGWARSGVDQARTLARRGAASFRIDMTGFGDSSSPLSAEPPRLCDPQHVADALAAVDWLEGRGLGPVLAVGRCSGASVALAAAMRDARIRELVLINPRRFSADFDDFGETAGERLAHYRDRLSAPAAVLRRGLRGELDLWAAICSLGGAAARRAWAARAATSGAGGGGWSRASRRSPRAACARPCSIRRRGRPGARSSRRSARAAAGCDGSRAWRSGGSRARTANLTPAAVRAALVELLCERALTRRRRRRPDPADARCSRLEFPFREGRIA